MRCSPPERVPACCVRRSPRRGKSSKARSRPGAISVLAPAPPRPSTRFSSTVRVPNTERPSGAWSTPRRATAWVGLAGQVLAVDPEAPSGRGQEAGGDPGHGRLARAVGPEQGDRAAVGHRQGHAEQGAEGAVGGVDVVQLEHRRAVISRPQVGLAHGLVAEDVGGGALGDEGAEVEHVEAAGHRAHQLDVVLDQQDRPVPLLADAGRAPRPWRAVSSPSSPLDGSSSSSRRGSIMRARPSSTRRALPEAQRLDRSVGQGEQAEQVEDLVHPLELVRGRPALAPQVPPEPARVLPGPLGDQQVVSHAHAGEQLDALERAPDAQPGPLVDPLTDQVSPQNRTWPPSGRR